MRYDQTDPSTQFRREAAIDTTLPAPARTGWPSAATETTDRGLHTPEDRSRRTRHHRALALIVGTIAVALLSAGAGMGIGWTVAHRDTTAAKERLGLVQNDLARTTALQQACAETTGDAQDVYRGWDEIQQGEAEWQAAKPGSPAERRIGARLDRLYAELDGRVQAAKATSDSCLPKTQF